MFILLDEARLYTFLDLAFDLVDLVLWGMVGATPHYGPFKLRFEFEVHLDQLLARERSGQRSEHLLVLLDGVIHTMVKIQALKFFGEVFLSMEVASPSFLFFHSPHRMGEGASSALGPLRPPLHG